MGKCDPSLLPELSHGAVVSHQPRKYRFVRNAFIFLYPATSADKLFSCLSSRQWYKFLTLHPFLLILVFLLPYFNPPTNHQRFGIQGELWPRLPPVRLQCDPLWGGWGLGAGQGGHVCKWGSSSRTGGVNSMIILLLQSLAVTRAWCPTCITESRRGRPTEEFISSG